MLVLDTNILGDIVQDSTTDLFTALIHWIKTTIEGAPCSVDKRRIDFGFTTKILNDYKAGLSQRHVDSRLIGALELSLTSNIKNPVPVDATNGRFFLVPLKFAFEESHLEIRDPNDVKFADLVVGLLASRKYSDRYVILASRDRPTIRDFGSARSRDIHDDSKFKLEESRESLELLLKDP